MHKFSSKKLTKKKRLNIENERIVGRFKKGWKERVDRIRKSNWKVKKKKRIKVNKLESITITQRTKSSFRRGFCPSA